MLIKKVTINYFLSFGPNNIIDLESRGIVAIRGINNDTGGSNGSGKSACFLEAIVWCLTGDTVRKYAKIDGIVNRQIGRNCSVSIETENATITRYRKHDIYGNGLIFIKDGKDETNASTKITQKNINLTYNIDYNAFVNSLIITPDNKLNFLDDKNSVYRRQIIENILGVDLYKDYQITTRDLAKNVRNRQDLLLASISTYKDQIGSFKARIRDLEVKRLEYDQDKEKKIQEKLREIESLKSIDIQKELKKHATTKAANEVLKDNDRQVGIYLKDMSRIETDIKNTRNEISKYKDLSIAACSYCGSTLDELKAQNIITILSAKIVQLTAELAATTIKKDELSTQYTNIYHKMKSLKSTIEEADLYTWKQSIDNAEKNLEEYRQLANPYKEITFDADIETCTQQMQICEQEEQVLALDLLYYRFWEEAYGNAGLKVHVIDEMIEYFNKRIAHYIDILSDGKITIRFDKYLECTINGFDYGTCSSGERRRIDLAVLLALHDLNNLQHKCSSNILILDEVLDSVDDIGIEYIKDLLDELKKAIPTILVISHNNTLIEGFSNFITIIRNKGISYVES